jgi:hypothetical protein
VGEKAGERAGHALALTLTLLIPYPTQAHPHPHAVLHPVVIYLPTTYSLSTTGRRVLIASPRRHTLVELGPHDAPPCLGAPADCCMVAAAIVTAAPSTHPLRPLRLAHTTTKASLQPCRLCAHVAVFFGPSPICCSLVSGASTCETKSHRACSCMAPKVPVTQRLCSSAKQSNGHPKFVF